MSIAPPFMYERPAGSRWDAQLDRGFNPRAVTQAAWEKAQKDKEPKPKQEGPLIDSKELNKHPDSYMIVPYGQLDFKPLSKHAKAKVTWTRRIQLALRILEFFGSVGLIVCMILIIPSGDGSDWIIRIPPAIAIIHAFYGCWHLSRGPAKRTAPSSASYFIFGAIIDGALVPFFFFSAWIVRQQWVTVGAGGEAADNAWKTMVDHIGPQVRPLILFVTWIDAVSLGGISVLAFAFCVYLAIQFRKISELPPDMNPFEENLTKLGSRRHKKGMSDASELTVATGSVRDSTASLLAEKGRTMPWMHTREGSTTSLPPYSAPPQSPTKSRPDSGISMTSASSPNRLSQLHVVNGSSASINNPKRRQGHARTDSAGAVLPPANNNSNNNSSFSESPLRQNVTSPFNAAPPNLSRPPVDESRLRVPAREANASPGAASSVYSDAESWYTDVPGDAQSLHSRPSNKISGGAAKLRAADDGMKDWPLRHRANDSARMEHEWFAVGEISDDSEDEGGRPRQRQQGNGRSDVPEFSHLRSAPSHVAPGTPPRGSAGGGKYDFSNRSPRPLEMHPPTPPGVQPRQGQNQRQHQHPTNPTTPNSAQRMSYPQYQNQSQNQTPPQAQQRLSFPQQRTPGNSPYANREARRNRLSLQPGSTAANTAANRGSGNSNALVRRGDWVEDGGYVNEAAGLVGMPQQSQTGLTPGRRGGERVVSSGYEDERRGGINLRSGGILKNRQVSGKVAEEGRGGVGSTWGLGSGIGSGIGSGMNALRKQMGW